MPSVGAVGAITSSLRAKRNNLSSVLTSVKGKASAVAAAAGSAVRQAKGKLDAVLQPGAAPATDPAAAVTGAHPQEEALGQLEAMGFSREAAECALLQLDGADVEQVAEFLCEQERLIAAPPPVTQASDPELYWAMQASLNADQVPADIAPSPAPRPWFLRPSTGTWLAPLPVTCNADAEEAVVEGKADAEEEAVVEEAVVDDAISKADAEEEAVVNGSDAKDMEETHEDDKEKLVAPSTQADVTMVTDKLSESMELPSPTRAGTIRGGA